MQQALPPILHAYSQLMRLDKPVGIWLLLFPAWMALGLATPPGQLPDGFLLAAFGVGAVLMRGAGCAVNDVLDRDLDRQVARTRNRPVASGRIKPFQALLFAVVLSGISLMVVLAMRRAVLGLAVCALPLVVAYPLMKRITWWPQAWLGLTFNWGALMGFVAATGRLASPAWLLYGGCFFWTLGYDTIYAFQDKSDDEKAGIKSTARLLGSDAAYWVAGWYGLAWLLIVLAGYVAAMGGVFYLGMAAAAMQLGWQVRGWRKEDPASSLAMFRSNPFFGGLVFLALLAGRL